MISNEERREVAAKLASEAKAWRDTFPNGVCELGDVSAVMQDLCEFAGLRGEVMCSEIFQRFSDIIDRPTAKQEHNGAYWRCAHCGAFTRKDAVVVDGLGVVPLRCCGNCGREWE
ncbi:hypothetical protein [Senegalimassilia sp.]